jgi:hypothetical protein
MPTPMPILADVLKPVFLDGAADALGADAVPDPVAIAGEDRKEDPIKEPIELNLEVAPAPAPTAVNIVVEPTVEVVTPVPPDEIVVTMAATEVSHLVQTVFLGYKRTSRKCGT